MRTIVAGSRTINDYELLCHIMKNIKWRPTVIISGGAKGVDKLGEQYARDNNIQLEIYKADWNAFGKRAGYIRNAQMGDVADALIAIWDNSSLGTKHMIDYANSKNLKVYVYIKGD